MINARGKFMNFEERRELDQLVAAQQVYIRFLRQPVSMAFCNWNSYSVDPPPIDHISIAMGLSWDKNEERIMEWHINWNKRVWKLFPDDITIHIGTLYEEFQAQQKSYRIKYKFHRQLDLLDVERN